MKKLLEKLKKNNYEIAILSDDEIRSGLNLKIKKLKMENDILFFIDIKNNIYITWQKLLNDINSTNSVQNYIHYNSFYDIFLQVIKSYLFNNNVILINSELKEFENKSIIDKIKISSTKTKLSFNFSSKDEFLHYISNYKSKGSITLLTSGSTGLPKIVTHYFDSLNRFVKTGKKYTHDIWGLAYHPAHIAGLQVFLQAFFNGNLIVRLFGLEISQIKELILKYNINRISATPTFYRLLVDKNLYFENVKSITSGGEKIDNELKDSLKNIFKNAKFINVYASTEAGSLFASDDEWFYIPEHVKDYVKIVNNQIFIHKTYIGFIENNSDNEWYSTGDVIEWENSEKKRFKIVGRINDIIKVGGYKVNLQEIEEAINQIKTVKICKVYNKKNSVLGNIICSDIVVKENCLLNEKEVRNFLRDKLQEYKIPRLIRFVENIETTYTGKLTRK
ncbi:MAG: long-chain fatty acid--CoA ligase [Bacteroidales bacterium]|nr:long-chain fatty acid--CoA ligase [Bacteroidales bacterium]